MLLSLSKYSLPPAFILSWNNSGSVYVLFIPGFIISFIFFPIKNQYFDHQKKRLFKKQGIDTLERIALSFALSIAIVPLTVFYLNLIGLKISTLNVFLTILAIIIISSIILVIKNRKITQFK